MMLIINLFYKPLSTFINNFLTMKQILPFSLFLFALQNLFAQSPEGNFPPPDLPPVVQAVRASGNIRVDGQLDEADWQQAPLVSDFFRMEPIQGGEVHYPTTVRFLFDSKNLYVGVFCQDSLGKKGVRVQDFRRDFIYGESDVFYFQLDPQNLRRYCVSFQATPIGTLRDLQVFDDEIKDNDWDALWQVKTTISATGWSAEFAIPFKSLRYERPTGDSTASWGLTLARLARRNYEMTVFPPVPQSFSPYRMTYAARLTGLELPKPALNLRLQPYLLAQTDRNTFDGNRLPGRETVKIGGEAKWAINPHAVLDFTANTDFAQADVDRAVNNLSRFNVFFPERRQFFLENSGIYPNDGEILPYFSRTIGLQNSQFNAEPVPIDAGLRFNDRNTKRAISAMYVHQRGTDEQGGANFGLFRYQKNYGAQNNIGVMLTHRYDQSTESVSDNNNTTLTADGLIRPNDQFQIQYLLSGSRDQGTGRYGTAGKLFFGQNNNRFYWNWSSNWVSSNYLPGMGFVFQNNVAHHNPGGYYIWRAKKEKALVRRMDPGLSMHYYHNASDGKFQQANLYLFPVYVVFRDNSFLEGSLFPTWQRIDFSFAPLAILIPQQDYFYTRYFLRYSSDASRKFSVSSSLETGPFYDGQLTTINASLRFAPIPNIALSGEYEHNFARDLGENNTDTDVDLWTASLRLAANPRLQAQVFYQYNTLDRRGRWNARLSWEFRPLSFVYLVFNNTQQRGLLGTDPVMARSTGLIGKVSYMRQL